MSEIKRERRKERKRVKRGMNERKERGKRVKRGKNEWNK